MFNLISKTKLFLNYSLRIFKVLHCSVIKVRFVVFVVPYRSDLTILSHSFSLVKNFFNFFEEVFSALGEERFRHSRSGTCLSYHTQKCLSTTFLRIINSFLIRNGERGIWTLAPGLPTYTLSRGASSASWVFLLKFISYDIHFTSGSTHRLLYLMNFGLSTRFLRFYYRTLPDSFLTYYILKKQPSIHLHFFIIISSYV